MSLDLGTLRALCDAATPGPWTADIDDHGRVLRILANDREADNGLGPEREFEKIVETIVETDAGYYPPEQPDALFIASTRTAMPALIDEIERLRGLLGDICADVADGGTTMRVEFWDRARALGVQTP